MAETPEAEAVLRVLAQLRQLQDSIPNPAVTVSVTTTRVTAVPGPETFVDPSRLAELRSLKPASFDLTKLIRYCEELDLAYERNCLLTVPMLGRAILDHVAPIFGCKKFTEVANNYGGTSSFKKSMQHLDNSLRNIADSYLHVQIRKTEVLPNPTQVDFRPDLDVLLGEIVRLLK